MEMGPKTVSRLRTRASGPPTARSRDPGTGTAMGVTLPSFGTRRGPLEETGVVPSVAGRPYPGAGRTPLYPVGGRNVGVVDNRTEVREFLSTRRAKLTPDQAGVPLYGQR